MMAVGSVRGAGPSRSTADSGLSSGGRPANAFHRETDSTRTRCRPGVVEHNAGGSRNGQLSGTPTASSFSDATPAGGPRRWEPTVLADAHVDVWTITDKTGQSRRTMSPGM